jgi:hypothetical protein
MKIAIVYDLGTPFTTGVYIERSLKELGMTVDHFDHNEINTVPEGYELYFIIDSGPIYDIPRWKSGISVYYAIDVHLDFESRLKMAKTATVPIMAQFTCGAEKATKQGLETIWLPLGCDPWIHQDYQVTRDLDIAFIGNIYSDDSWRSSLKDRLLAYGFEEDKIFIGSSTKEQIGEIYSRAKIVLNHSVRNNRQDISMRFFEAMSCGAYLLTQKLLNDDTDKIIDPKLYSTYETDVEMFKKIEEILANWTMYNDTAQKAKLFVRTFHTYTKHIESLFRYMTMPKEKEEEIKKIITP